jgi:hypothetical protein
VNLSFIPLFTGAVPVAVAVVVAVEGFSGEVDRSSTLDDRLDAEAEAEADLVAALPFVFVGGLVILSTSSLSGDADGSDLLDDGASDNGDSPPNASIVIMYV